MLDDAGDYIAEADGYDGFARNGDEGRHGVEEARAWGMKLMPL